MIIKKQFRAKTTKVCQRRANPIAINGKVFIQLHIYDGNKLNFDVVVEAHELREMRDQCNRALEQITGYEYSTTVAVK